MGDAEYHKLRRLRLKRENPEKWAEHLAARRRARTSLSETQRETARLRTAKWRETNLATPEAKEAAREYAAAWAVDRRRSDPEWAEKHRRRITERAKTLARDPATWPLVALKYSRERATALGCPHAIRAEDIVVPGVCPVYGIVLKFGGRRTHNSPSLDRLIPALGYVPGNVRVISWLANAHKSNATLAQHRELVAWMERELEPAAQHTEGLIF